MKRDLSILMMNMEKVKTFKNLALIPQATGGHN